MFINKDVEYVNKLNNMPDDDFNNDFIRLCQHMKNIHEMIVGTMQDTIKDYSKLQEILPKFRGHYVDGLSEIIDTYVNNAATFQTSKNATLLETKIDTSTIKKCTQIDLYYSKKKTDHNISTDLDIFEETKMVNHTCDNYKNIITGTYAFIKHLKTVGFECESCHKLCIGCDNLSDHSVDCHELRVMEMLKYIISL